MMIKKISITECAKQCGISRVTLYSYIKKGTVVPRKTPGGKSFFLQEDVDKIKQEVKYGI